MARVGFMIVIVIVIAIVTRDVVLIDRDASVIGAAGPCTHGRRIAATTNDRHRGHLGDEAMRDRSAMSWPAC